MFVCGSQDRQDPQICHSPTARLPCTLASHQPPLTSAPRSTKRKEEVGMLKPHRGPSGPHSGRTPLSPSIVSFTSTQGSVLCALLPSSLCCYKPGQARTQPFGIRSAVINACFHGSCLAKPPVRLIRISRQTTSFMCPHHLYTPATLSLRASGPLKRPCSRPAGSPAHWASER